MGLALIMRPWQDPEHRTQKYYQISTTNGYVGGLFSLLKPESTSVGDPSQPSDGWNNALGPCSDEKNEVKAITSVTPTTVPAGSIQPDFTSHSGSNRQRHAQDWTSSDPNTYYSYNEWQYPGLTTGLFRSQYASCERPAPSLGNRASQAQPATRSTAVNYRKLTNPSNECKSRAEYVHLMQKAKYRFEVAAAGGNGLPLPSTANPRLPFQQTQNHFGYLPDAQPTSHIPVQQPSSIPQNHAFHEAVTPFDRHGEDIARSRSFIQRPTPSSARRYELSPNPTSLPNTSDQQTAQLPSPRTANLAPYQERSFPAQTATSKSSGKRNIGTAAAQSPVSIDRAFNAARAAMSPVSAGSTLSQRAAPVTAVPVSQSFSALQNHRTGQAQPALMSDHGGQSKYATIPRGVVECSSVASGDKPDNSQECAKSRSDEDSDLSTMTLHATEYRYTSQTNSATEPASVTAARSTKIGEVTNAPSNSPPRPSKHHPPPRNLPFASIPPVTRALVFLWQRSHGRTELPFAVGGSMVPLVNQSKDGLPAVYRSRDGVRYQVNIFGLPSSWSPSGIQRLVIIATEPKGHSFIIGRHKNMNKVKVIQGLGIPYCIWTGTTYPNPDGWEDEPSIYKTWDGRQVIQPSKDEVPSKPNVPLGISKPSATANTRKQICSDTEKAGGHENQAHLSSAPVRPALDPKLCVRLLPPSLKLLIQQWQVFNGSGQPLPCTMHYGNYPTVFENATGRTCSYYHRNGDALVVWACRISRALSGDKSKNTVIMATGKNTPPCIISSKKYFAFQETSDTAYSGNWCVWEGVHGRGEYGFEKECSITKVSDDKAPSRRIGFNEILPVPPEQAASSDLTEEDSIDGELLRLADREPSVTTSTGTPAPPTTLSARPDAVPETHAIPKTCRELINQWFRRHPNQPLHSLPCISTSGRSTLFETGTKQAIEWYDIHGQQLSVEMYSLFNQDTTYTLFHPLNSPGPGHPSSSLFNKRVIVVQGSGMAPTLVSVRAQNKSVDGKLAIQRWVGVEGDHQGWELGRPEIFECNAKEIRQNWKRSFPIVESSAIAYQRPHRRQATALSSISEPAANCQRTGCWTCHTRKEKCDEGRPICGQCTLGGRNCGYSPALSLRNDTPRELERMQEPEREMETRRQVKEDSIEVTPMTTRSRTKPTADVTGSASAPSSRRYKACKSIALSELRPHLNSHLVCLFYSYSPSISTPRARLFAACDTVEKLFAQAMAGSVFADRQDDRKGKSEGRASARVLSVSLNGKKRIAVAEEDKEDFDSVVDAIAVTGWWGYGDEGDVVGSGTLEVRAFV